jgi:hypothetical protein
MSLAHIPAARHQVQDGIKPGVFCVEMINLLQDDRTVIAKHSMDDSLDDLRDLLRKAG